MALPAHALHVSAVLGGQEGTARGVTRVVAELDATLEDVALVRAGHADVEAAHRLTLAAVCAADPGRTVVGDLALDARLEAEHVALDGGQAVVFGEAAGDALGLRLAVLTVLVPAARAALLQRAGGVAAVEEISGGLAAGAAAAGATAAGGGRGG